MNGSEVLSSHVIKRTDSRRCDKTSLPNLNANFAPRRHYERAGRGVRFDVLATTAGVAISALICWMCIASADRLINAMKSFMPGSRDERSKIAAIFSASELGRMPTTSARLLTSFVQAFERVRRVHLRPVPGGEIHVGQHVGLAVVDEGRRASTTSGRNWPATWREVCAAPAQSGRMNPWPRAAETMLCCP